MRPLSQSLLVRYGVAVLAVALATGVRLLLHPVVGDQFPFATLFFAVLVVAWLEGFGPALAATFVGGMAAARFLLPPRDSFAIHDLEHQAGLCLYLVLGCGMALLGGGMRTARVRAEAEAATAALQREELRTTLASIGDAVIVTDEQGRVVSLNAVAVGLTGWGDAEARGQPLERVFHIVNEHTRQTVESPVPRVLRDGGIVGLANHTVLIARDGKETPIDDSGAPIRSVAGTITGVVLVFRDVSERKVAEQALRESEATLRAFYDHSPVCMGLTEPTGDGDVLHLYDNPATCRFFGAAPGATTGQRALADLGGDPDVVARWLDCYRQSAALGQPVQFEHQYHTPGGDRWLAATVCPIGPGPNGRLRFCYVAEDVTERRQGQEQLRQSEERLRLALDAGRMGVWDWDVRTNQVQWSDNLEAIHGLAAGTFGGTLEAFQALVHPEDRAAVNQAIARALAEPSSYDIEFRNVWPDGSVHWMAGKGKAFIGDDGQPARLIGVATDVTAKRRAEQDARFLADASAALAGLVDHESTLQKLARLAVPSFGDWAAVDLLDDGGALRRVAVAHVNPAKVELAHELHRRFPPDPAAPQGVWTILRTGQPELLADIGDDLLVATVKNADLLRILRELALRSYIGVPLTVRDQTIGVVTFIAAESGRRYDAADLALAQDLAHRAAVAVENARLYQEVRAADQKKDEFLAVLAHELRNPLASIRNAVQILKLAGADSDMAAQARAMAERQLHSLTRLVDDLLDVSRIMRGKIELKRERADLNAIVARAVETARPAIDAGGHELVVHRADAPIWVEADVVRLAQVVSNLLHNSAKYTDRGGHIWLTAARESGQAVVRVRDSGIGIAPDKLRAVFDLFMQVDAAGHRAQGGLGIGLTVVQNLVALHGGKVAAHSDGLGRGSEFVVRLPLLDRVDVRLAGPVLDRVTTQRARKVLVTDDNVDAARSLAMLLRLSGHDVRVAHDGPEALQLAQADPPDLAFLDIGMPQMDGLEVARRFRANDALRGVTLIALTGWGQEEDRRRTQEAGFDHHLVKPVEPEALHRLFAAQ